MTGEGDRDFWRVLAGYFFPPLGVFLQVGLGLHFWINLALTVFLFYFPGALHAMWVIANTGPGGRSDPDGGSKFVAILLAALIPPVAVLMKKGVGIPLVVNVILWMFFMVPGTLHAVWVITHDD